MHITVWGWIGFNLFILFLLALDLGVFHRKSHAISTKEAALWTVAWISMAMIFNAGIYYFAGPTAGLQFLTGYLLEKSLSVDNIFVFVLLFGLFAVPPAYQHRLLFWGVGGRNKSKDGAIGRFVGYRPYCCRPIEESWGMGSATSLDDWNLPVADHRQVLTSMGGGPARPHPHWLQKPHRNC